MPQHIIRIQFKFLNRNFLDLFFLPKYANWLKLTQLLITLICSANEQTHISGSNKINKFLTFLKSCWSRTAPLGQLSVKQATVNYKKSAFNFMLNLERRVIDMMMSTLTLSNKAWCCGKFDIMNSLTLWEAQNSTKRRHLPHIFMKQPLNK